MCYICIYVIKYPLLDASKIQHEEGDQIIIFLKIMVIADLQILVGPAEN
jgi:hypothetical protein